MKRDQAYVPSHSVFDLHFALKDGHRCLYLYGDYIRRYKSRNEEEESEDKSRSSKKHTQRIGERTEGQKEEKH